MKIVDQIALGCIIDILSSPQTYEIKVLCFVDDKTKYVNDISRVVRESMTELMEVSICTFNYLLYFVVGKLETSKCEFSLLNGN